MEGSILTTVILPASLALIMFGMGLSLTIADFKRVLKFPKAVFLGTFNQIILLPLIAFLLINLFGFTGGLAVGVMIIAACPGGTTSNIISHVSKGDTALSVTLTAVSTLITFFSIPFVITFAINYFTDSSQQISLPITETFGALFLITILPISIGMIIKSKFNDFALKMDKPVRIASIIVFVVIVVGIIIKEKDNFIDFMRDAGVISIALNIVTMLLGYFVAKGLKLNTKQAVTIAIESGIQNGTLALLIATKLIQNANPEMAIAPAVYSLLMFFTGGFIMYYFSKKLR